MLSYRVSSNGSVQVGFTLIEIVIALLVLGILVSIAFPSYQSYVARGEVSRCYNFLATSRIVVDNAIALNGGSAIGLTAANMGIEGLDCDAGIDVTANNLDGSITLRGSSIVPGQADRVRLSYRRIGATAVWSCTSNAAAAGITPELCP